MVSVDRYPHPRFRTSFYKSYDLIQDLTRAVSNEPYRTVMRWVDASVYECLNNPFRNKHAWKNKMRYQRMHDKAIRDVAHQIGRFIWVATNS